MFSYRAKKAMKLPGEIFFLTYLCLAPVKDISLYMGAGDQFGSSYILII